MVDSSQEQKKGHQSATSEEQGHQSANPSEERRQDKLATPSEEQKPEVTPSAGWRPEDVLLDIPQLTIDTIELEVSDLKAHVSLVAEVLNLVKLSVGVDATLGKADLDIRGVRAQALLKVRLDKVAEIVDGVVALIDHHPEIVKDLVKGAGQAIEEFGRGAGEALPQVGQGAGQAAQQTGQGVSGKPGEGGPGQPQQPPQGQPGQQDRSGQQQGGKGQQADRGQGAPGRTPGGPRTRKWEIEASATVEGDQWWSGEPEQRQQGREKAQRDESSARGGLPHRPPRRW
jgi:hypothetical protein